MTKRTLVKSMIALTALSFLALPAFAAEIIQPTRDNPNVTVGAAEKHKNLYLAGANVTVNADTAADLAAAGGMVLVTGKVEQEALLAGGTVYVSGAIGGNARVAGGNITISGPVGGDLVVAGGNVNLTGSASVAGDLLIAGGNLNIDAPVAGDIRMAGGTAIINSKVGGKVYARSQSLSFGSSAEVLSGVEYKGEQTATVAAGARVGEISFTKIRTKDFRGQVVGLFSLAILLKLLAWLVAAYVLLKFKKGFVLSLAEDFKARPWANLGWGLLALFGGPILVVLLFVTLVGYYLAFILGLMYALAIVATNLISAMVLGYFLLSKLSKAGETLTDWQAVVIGVVVWVLLRFIPVLGWLAMAIVFLMVLGAGVKRLKSGMEN